MTAKETLRELADLGVSVRVHENSLQVDGTFPCELGRELKRHKTEIIALLTRNPIVAAASMFAAKSITAVARGAKVPDHLVAEPPPRWPEPYEHEPYWRKEAERQLQGAEHRLRVDRPTKSEAEACIIALSSSEELESRQLVKALKESLRRFATARDVEKLFRPPLRGEGEPTDGVSEGGQKGKPKD